MTEEFEFISGVSIKAGCQLQRVRFQEKSSHQFELRDQSFGRCHLEEDGSSQGRLFQEWDDRVIVDSVISIQLLVLLRGDMCVVLDNGSGSL